MAHGRGGRTPRRDTPRVSAIGLARTPTLRKAVAFEQRRGSKPPLRGDRGSGGGARAALRSSVGTARAHTLVHLLPLVASSGMRKQTYLYGLGMSRPQCPGLPTTPRPRAGRAECSGRKNPTRGTSIWALARRSRRAPPTASSAVRIVRPGRHTERDHSTVLLRTPPCDLLYFGGEGAGSLSISLS